MTTWDEGQHPRTDGGQFAAKAPAPEDSSVELGRPLTGYEVDDPDRPPVDVEVERARLAWLAMGRRARPRYINERPAGQFYSQSDFRAEMAAVHGVNSRIDEVEHQYRDAERRWKAAGSPTMPANWTICEYCGSTIDQWDGCPTCD